MIGILIVGALGTTFMATRFTAKATEWSGLECALCGVAVGILWPITLPLWGLAKFAARMRR